MRQVDAVTRYEAGNETARRKHTWLPCIINASLDGKSEEEVVRALRETWWSDNVTNAEWPALLGHDGVKAYVRSRLKRKVVGWLMAMGRLAALNPTLYNQAVQEAKRLYAEQLGEPHPMFYPDDVADSTQQNAAGDTP
jgi:hypothetical protein